MNRDSLGDGRWGREREKSGHDREKKRQQELNAELLRLNHLNQFKERNQEKKEKKSRISSRSRGR